MVVNDLIRGKDRTKNDTRMIKNELFVIIFWVTGLVVRVTLQHGGYPQAKGKRETAMPAPYNCVLECKLINGNE